MKPIPQPRVCRHFGQETVEQINPDGTWLEPEILCYPRGGMTRRARVRCPDGKIRVVRCGIPDTFFSIPGRVSYGGHNYTGFVTGATTSEGNPTLEFVATSSKPGKGGKPEIHPGDALLMDVLGAFA